MTEFKIGPQKYRASNGTPYVTIINGHVHREGDVIPKSWREAVLGGDVVAAAKKSMEAFNAGLQQYLSGEGAELAEWRIPPTVEHGKTRGKEWVYVRARVAVIA